MMEKDDIFKNDFLRELIRRSPLDSPSEDFVDNVMANIRLSPEVPEIKKPFYLYLKAAIPYVVLSVILIVVVATSDLPIFSWMPGKDYITGYLLPYLGSLAAILKNAFASKFVTWGLLISVSVGVLFLFDRLLSRRTAA